MGVRLFEQCGQATGKRKVHQRDEHFELSDGATALCAGDTNWHVDDAELRMHNSFWGWEDNEYSTCYVRGYIGGHNFATGPASKHTFVIECDGHLYPASRHTAAGGIDRRGDETTGKVAYIATATATVSTLLWPVLVVKATKLLPRRHPCKVARGSYRPATAGGG